MTNLVPLISQTVLTGDERRTRITSLVQACSLGWPNHGVVVPAELLDVWVESLLAELSPRLTQEVLTEATTILFTTRKFAPSCADIMEAIEEATGRLNQRNALIARQNILRLEAAAMGMPSDAPLDDVLALVATCRSYGGRLGGMCGNPPAWLQPLVDRVGHEHWHGSAT